MTTSKASKPNPKRAGNGHGGLAGVNPIAVINKNIHLSNGNEPKESILIPNFTNNVDFLKQWQNISFWVKQFFGQATKDNFELNMLKLLENHVKTKV